MRENTAREKRRRGGVQWGEVNKGKVEFGKTEMAKKKEERREWGEKWGKEKGKYREREVGRGRIKGKELEWKRKDLRKIETGKMKIGNKKREG